MLSPFRMSLVASNAILATSPPTLLNASPPLKQNQAIYFIQIFP